MCLSLSLAFFFIKEKKQWNSMTTCNVVMRNYDLHILMQMSVPHSDPLTSRVLWAFSSTFHIQEGKISIHQRQYDRLFLKEGRWKGSWLKISINFCLDFWKARNKLCFHPWNGRKYIAHLPGKMAELTFEVETVLYPFLFVVTTRLFSLLSIKKNQFDI